MARTIDAVECTVAIQRSLAQRYDRVPRAKAPYFFMEMFQTFLTFSAAGSWAVSGSGTAAGAASASWATASLEASSGTVAGSGAGS